jgi:hypothetical protein
MSKCNVDDSSIKNCSESINAFSEALKSEQKRRDAWQTAHNAWRAYMNTRSYQIQLAQQRLQAGKTSADGHIWDGNTHVRCASITPRGAGPFNLCGYHPQRVKACLSCARADPRGNPRSPFYQRDANGNPWGCNCASCAEGCCQDCSTSSRLRYNPNVSWYQGTYNAIVNRYPPRAAPKFVAIPITAGDFLCMQCVQCTEFSNLSAGQQLSIGDTNQVQQCVANMEGKKQKDDQAAAAEKARLAAEAEKARLEAIADAEYAKNMKIAAILVLIFIFAVVIYVLYSRSTTGAAEVLSLFNIAV